MTSLGIGSHSLAQQLNQLLTGSGGQAIPGLEHVDPSKLLKLRDGLTTFLDQFDDAARHMPELSQLAGSETMKAVRELARLASAQVDSGAGRAGAHAPGAAGFDPLAANVAAVSLVGGLLGSALAGHIPGLMQGMAAPPGGTAAGQAPQAQAPAGAAAGAGAAAPAARSTGIDPQLDALKGAGGGGGFFEDRLFALMSKIVEDMQKKIEERMNKLQKEAEAAEKGGGKGGKGGGIGGMVGGLVGGLAGPIGGMAGKAIGGAIGGGGGGGDAGGAGGGESRNIEFEKIKNDMQKLSQMQQALSNVLNTLDELAKSAIRHIKV